MTEETQISEEEWKRREAFLYEGSQPYNAFDPFTWSFPSKIAFSSGCLLFAACTWHALWNRKPWYSALAIKLGANAVGVTAAYWLAKMRARSMAERDAVISHYVSLHPEDFERINNFAGRPYRDILLPWAPLHGQYRKVEKDV